MAWYNPFSWYSGAKNVSYREEIGPDGKTNYVYRLDQPYNGDFTSCFDGGYSEQNIKTMFENVAEVFAPMDGIASRAANGRFILKRISTDAPIYTNKYINSLLDKPNPFQKWHDFVYTAVIHKLIGNRYLYAKIPSTLAYDYQNVTGLWSLRPWMTSARPKPNVPNIFDVVSTSDVIDKYLTNWNGRQIEIDPQFIQHDTAVPMDAQDNNNGFLKGFSPLRTAEKPLSNLIVVYVARNVIYVKRGALGAIVSKKSDESGNIALTESEKKALQADFQNDYGLSHGKSQQIITAMPVDYIRFGNSIQELQPFEETQADANAIASVLKYPKELLPQSKAQTYENLTVAEKSVYTNAAIPEAKELCQAINNALRLADHGIYLDVSFDHVEFLQEDKNAQANRLQTQSTAVISLYNNGFITRNQGLVLIGEEPVPDPSFDEYKISNNEANPQDPSQAPIGASASAV